ncbi:hypothetical protein FD755_002283 [Muntiacus reevesi]|uniref:C19orf38 Ig domain-containing protein n=1 Tax=Muntiacus reevesi TaxID=9886 RepID=A0A5J5N3K8_MUNRE|nr:hypothetical protein FD755_002283 [Muntiacus reevesi]
MPWIFLLLAAGSLAIPAPSIMLVPPHPSSQEDPIHILCMAPRGFPGANFTLYQGGEVVELLKAPKDQLRVIFNLSGGSREARGGPFCCQYSVLGENRQPQLSNLSEPVHVSFPVQTLNLYPQLHLSLLATIFMSTCYAPGTVLGIAGSAVDERKPLSRNLAKVQKLVSLAHLGQFNKNRCYLGSASGVLCAVCWGTLHFEFTLVTASKGHRASLLTASTARESLPVRWDAHEGALSRENPTLCTSVSLEHVLNSLSMC